jgi:hypothetical protein
LPEITRRKIAYVGFNDTAIQFVLLDCSVVNFPLNHALGILKVVLEANSKGGMNRLQVNV